jgi:peptidoglycan/LPS O-acetylase OafA/YrhL
MKTEIRALTGIRGIAACYVVLFHFWGTFGTVNFVDTTVSPMVSRGYLAVDLFFCLSGYIMAETYSHLFLTREFRVAYRLFLGRRLARIYPLYFSCVIATYFMMALGVVPQTTFTVTNLSANLASVQIWSWGYCTSLDGPAWSVSAEAAAYVLFPALAAATLFGSPKKAFISAIISVIGMALATRLPAELTGSPEIGILNILWAATPGPIVRCLAEFTTGLLAWRVSRTGWFRRMSTCPLLCEVVVGVILLLLLLPDTDLAVVGLFPLLISLIGTRESHIAQFLGSRIPYYLGVLSYSIYLVHVPVRDSLNHPLAEWTARLGIPHAWTCHVFLLVVAVGITAIVAHLGIERPSRKILRDLLEGIPLYRSAGALDTRLP